MEFLKQHQANIMLALASICFVILIFILITNYLSKEKKKTLLFFVFSTALLLFVGRYTYTYQDNSTSFSIFMTRLCKYLVFFNILNVVYGFGEFIKCIYKENHKDAKIPSTFTIVKIIILIGHVFLLISQFTNLYYSYDSLNIYHREKYYFICYLFPLIATILQYIVIIKEFKNTKRIILIPLVLYFTLPLIGSIIQLFIPGLALVNIIIGGVVIILYSATIYDANIMLEEKKKTEADLKLANEIQQNEIPNIFPAFPNRKEFDLYAMMLPAKDVGGDFYDYFLIDDNHLGLVIADVSGKGIPAALNMIKAKTMLKGISSNITDPGKVLTSLNTTFIDNNKLDMFVTIWFGIVEISTGKLTYANAGHEDLIIYKKNTGYDILKTKHNLPIGALNNSTYENNSITLDKGDKIFIYTDGVTEAININEKAFGINNLLKSLNEHKNEDVKNTINMVKKDINLFTDTKMQFDDITMLCFELKESENMMHYKKKFEAKQDEINSVYEFFKESLSNVFSEEKTKKYYVVLDEIFSNIVKYGYKDIKENRFINIYIDLNQKENKLTVIFEDNGIKFNPLEKEDPNTNLSAKDRNEGGLGIYIVKQMMDKVTYEYKDNKNILTLEKHY